jgi:hypothetical protein
VRLWFPPAPFFLRTSSPILALCLLLLSFAFPNCHCCLAEKDGLVKPWRELLINCDAKVAGRTKIRRMSDLEPVGVAGYDFVRYSSFRLTG